MHQDRFTRRGTAILAQLRDTGILAVTSRSERPRHTAGLLAAILLPAVLLATCVGCGQKINSVPVSGRVTLRGKPVADVALNFSPLTGNESAFAAYGKTDSDGRYTLRLVENNQPGATAGQNRVTLNESTGAPENDGGGPAVTFKLPFKARDGTMTIEVPASGTAAADFAF